MKRLAWLTIGLAACATTVTGSPRSVSPVVLPALSAHGRVAVDTAPKEPERLIPPETYVRTFLQLFGGLAPMEVQARARGRGQLFDTWSDYLAALGLPDYQRDSPRATQTNALMIAAFERLGIALCDRSVEHDLHGAHPPPLGDRAVFRFDLPAGEPDARAFAERFDTLHRLFLGYPAALAPTDRTARFFHVFQSVVARHTAPGAAHMPFTPDEMGWAAVCYGLIRHPEFHLY